MKANVLKYAQEFNDFGYAFGSEEGELVGSVLAISASSLEWWEQFPGMGEYRDDGFGNTVYMAPWVASDIAGVIIGGVGGALADKALTGEVNWDNVAVGVAFGAVTSSVGLAAKFGHWIQRRFTIYRPKS